MALNKPQPNESILASDVTNIVNHLEGANGTSLAWFLRSALASDFIIRLSDNAGSRKIIVQDSTGAEVASIDSDGNIVGGVS